LPLFIPSSDPWKVVGLLGISGGSQTPEEEKDYGSPEHVKI
jgi:hypothetical protein